MDPLSAHPFTLSLPRYPSQRGVLLYSAHRALSPTLAILSYFLLNLPPPASRPHQTHDEPGPEARLVTHAESQIWLKQGFACYREM